MGSYPKKDSSSAAPAFLIHLESQFPAEFTSYFKTLRKLIIKQAIWKNA